MPEPKSFFRSLPKLLATILGSLAAIATILGVLYQIGVIGNKNTQESKKEVGIEIKGGEIHAGRDVIGIQKIELSDEQLARALVIMQKNLPVVQNEELTAKIKAQQAEIGVKDAKIADARVAAGNKALELGKERMEDREFEKAVKEFDEALSYILEGSEAAGDVYINIASAYAYQYKWDDALEAYKQAGEIGKKLDKKQLLALAYSGTGTIYYSISKYDKALEYYNEALNIRREVRDKQGEGVTLNNIAATYHSWGKYDKALEYLEKALAIHRDVGNRREEGVTLNSIGLIYKAWDKYDQALEYCEKAIAMRREVGDRRGEGVTLFNMAAIYEKQGRTQEAVDNLEEVVRIVEVTKNPNLPKLKAYLERLKATLKKHDSQ